MPTRPLTPNRLPRLPRDVLREISQEMSDRIMAKAKVVASHVTGTTAYASTPIYEAFPERRITYLNWDNSLRIYAELRKPSHQALGALVFAGRCAHMAVAEGRRVETQVNVYIDFDARHPLSEILEPGPWQVELYDMLAHELTHAFDEGLLKQVRAGGRADRDLADPQAYYRQLQERKAFARTLAEHVLRRIQDWAFGRRKKTTLKRMYSTPDRFIQATLNSHPDMWVLVVNLTPRQLQQLYKDVYQFLDAEGYLVVLQELYS